jgi:hypothetical protein
MSSDAPSFADDELRDGIAVILLELTNLSFFARLMDHLGVSVRFFASMDWQGV